MVKTPQDPHPEDLDDKDAGSETEVSTPRVLPEAAKRALAEAAERRAQAEKDAALPKELGGRKGPEPTRFGDWEQKGIAHDF